MLNNVIKEFEKFILNYDLNDSRIKYKYDHSYRVMDISETIAKAINLSDEDIILAKIIALLHDVGRFEQLKVYNSFVDHESIDHGLLGSSMLFKDNLIRSFIKDNKYDEIIKKAIINHNKPKVEEGLNEKELLHAKIIRDADKIDILMAKATGLLKQNNKVLETDIISDEIYNDFFKEETINNTKRKTSLDKWISQFAFIFDINYSCSLKIIKEHKYIETIFNSISFKNKETIKRVEKIREFTMDYLNKN